MFKIISSFFLILIIFSFAKADEVKVFEFTKSELSKLEVRKVRGADNKTNLLGRL